MNHAAPFHQFMAEARRTYLVHHLEANGWNVSATARAIGMQRTYLFSLIRQLELVRPLERAYLE